MKIVRYRNPGSPLLSYMSMLSAFWQTKVYFCGSHGASHWIGIASAKDARASLGNHSRLTTPSQIAAVRAHSLMDGLVWSATIYLSKKQVCTLFVMYFASVAQDMLFVSSVAQDNTSWMRPRGACESYVWESVQTMIHI